MSGATIFGSEADRLRAASPATLTYDGGIEPDMHEIPVGGGALRPAAELRLDARSEAHINVFDFVHSIDLRGSYEVSGKIPIRSYSPDVRFGGLTHGVAAGLRAVRAATSACGVGFVEVTPRTQAAMQ